MAGLLQGLKVIVMGNDTMDATKAPYQALGGESGSVTSSGVRTSVLWRITNAIMTVFLALAAFVQINDDNPCLWVTLYTVPALLTATITFKAQFTEHVVWQSVCLMSLVASTLMAIYKLAYVVDLVSEDLHNPLVHMEGRELSGLSIIVFWLSLCKFTQVGRLQPEARSLTPVLLVVFVLGLVPLLAWAACFVEELASDVSHCQDMFPGLLGKAFSSTEL